MASSAAATPTFNPPAGAYSSAQAVTISTTTAGASIRYTTDGSTPSETVGTVYSGPVSVSSSLTLKAIAYKAGMTDSSISSASYVITAIGSNSAAFVKTDTATQGSWKGVYGSQGYNVVDDTVSYPAYVTVTPANELNYIWAGSTSDVRALQKALSSTDRIAATWYTSGSYTIDLNFNDGAQHRLAVYCLDYWNGARAQTLSILDGVTNAVLDSQSVSSFQNGKYLVWDLTGHVILRVTNAGGINAVIGGLFFDPANIGSTVATPTFNPPAGNYSSTQSVTISTTTTGASIRYTTDGSTPSETVGTVYSGPVSVSSGLTLKAIAYMAGMTDSAVASAAYTITIPAATPTFNPPAGSYSSAQSVTISSTTTGASIRYTTDGSTPSETVGTVYSGPVSVSSGLTLKAIAYMAGMTDSAVASAAYTITIPAATPTFNPPAGSYSSTQSVTISTTTTGASIRYTTDGSTPSETVGTVYSGPVSVSSSLTLKAIAYVAGMTDSAVASAAYTITIPAATPTFNPPAGSYSSAQSVTISSTTTGASIRYTTDGSTPSETVGTVYSGPVSVSSGLTLKAIAYMAGMTDSAVASAGYTITIQAATPTFNPPAGSYSSTQSVTISSTTTGASIRYTTDGSTPSETVGTLYSGPVSVSSSLTLKAIAYRTGMTDSAVASAAYTITIPAATPTFNPPAGSYSSTQLVTISTTTTGASIRYTTDGSTPSETVGTVYSGPVSVSSGLTLKAIAYGSGWADSGVATASYIITAGTSNAAVFVKTDTVTQGTWKGVYGANGYNVIDDTVAYPGYVTVTPASELNYIWAASTSDVRGLQKALSASDRLAATWYSSSSFTIDLNFNDGAQHQLAVYCVDWDWGGARAQTVSILDGATNAVLDSQNVTGFQNGKYLVWNLTGHVILRVTNAGGINAVISGLFF